MCVPEIYEKDGRWWRYCLTCDDGSNKYRRHPRGHRSRGDAEMSFRDHSRQLDRNRKAIAAYNRWRTAVLATDDWTYFNELWHARHPGIQLMPETPERVVLMHEIQERMRGEASR